MPPRSGKVIYDDDYDDDFEDDDYYGEEEDAENEYGSEDMPVQPSHASTAPASRFAQAIGKPARHDQGNRPEPEALPLRPEIRQEFDFSEPSPDDVAKEARRKQGAPGSSHNVAAPVPGGRQHADRGAAPEPSPKHSLHGKHSEVPKAAAPAYREPSTYVMEASLRTQLDGLAVDKPVLHVVVLGHVDAGKSTLVGRLLYEVGAIDKSLVRKNLQEAKNSGKASFGWAWAFDERPEERARGLTMDVSARRFDTPRHHVILLDAPGHQDFVPRAILGAAQADAAVLVVDGAPGAFESGFRAPSPGTQHRAGQTREHIQVARGLGVKQLIVVVSKMDTVGYDEARYVEVQEQLGPFLAASGFKGVKWLPVAATEGENIVQPAQDARFASWAPPSSLLDLVDELRAPARKRDGPLRFVVVQGAEGGHAGAAGTVLTGALAVGQQVQLVPLHHQARVKAVHVDGKAQACVPAGQDCEVTFTGAPPEALTAGCVVCHPSYPVSCVEQIKARVVVINVSRPIIPGQGAMLHMHAVSVPCRISKLLALLDKASGHVTKEWPALRTLRQEQAADVLIDAERCVCLEPWAECPVLHRLVLRIGDAVAAVGVGKPYERC